MTGKINQLLVYWYLQQIYIAEKKGICLCYKKKKTQPVLNIVHVLAQ